MRHETPFVEAPRRTRLDYLPIGLFGSVMGLTGSRWLGAWLAATELPNGWRRQSAPSPSGCSWR